VKIGVLTQYYGSHNYGGLLQAHALVQVLRQNGVDAEQICYIPQAISLEHAISSEEKNVYAI